MSNDQNATRNCSMVGFLGIMIQLALGVLSFSVLIIKRLREHPQRPWKIWLFDTSKQLVSQMMAHFINLTISIALAYNDSSSDECLWYFTTNVLDNTLGVLICVLCLKGIQKSLRQRGKQQYISGNYYKKQKPTMNIEIANIPKAQAADRTKPWQNYKYQNQTDTTTPRQSIKKTLNQQIDQDKQRKDQPERSVIQEGRIQAEAEPYFRYHINYKAWVVQLLIWMSVVVIGKSVLFGTEIGLQSPLKNLTFLLMGWIQAFPVLELVVVIVIVPVVMNGLAFWVQDNFLMKKPDKLLQGRTPLIEQSSQRQQPVLTI